MPAKDEEIGVYHRPRVPMYKVRVTVLEAHPECGAEHHVGDIWEQSHVKREGVEGFLCPTAFTSLAPVIYAMRYGGEFPWSEDPDVWVGCCIDVETPVKFEIRRLVDETWTAAEEEEKG